MQMMYTIDGYNGWRRQKLQSMPDPERKLNYIDESDHDLY